LRIVVNEQAASRRRMDMNGEMRGQGTFTAPPLRDAKARTFIAASRN
jgi:hypothetical protein